MSRFTLEAGKWYACEFIGDEFDRDKCSYSPIKILSIEPNKRGDRTFRLCFYHANYPEGVRSKHYDLETIERGKTLLLAKSPQHNPPRFLQIYDITPAWVSQHFPGCEPDRDIHSWLDRHF